MILSNNKEANDMRSYHVTLLLIKNELPLLWTVRRAGLGRLPIAILHQMTRLRRHSGACRGCQGQHQEDHFDLRPEA